MKKVAIIQARMGSTRLPGKVLLPLGGTTVLGCVVERLELCEALDEIVVATSSLESDDAVVRECDRLGIRALRGPAEDVLARFAGAASETGAGIIVRITADCPLIDGRLVNAMLEAFEGGRRACDYLSNTLIRTYPRGLDAEIFTNAGLQRCDAEARQEYEREHVTPYFYTHSKRFVLRAYVDPSGADRSDMRWTLDTPEDLAFFQAVYAEFYGRSPREITTSAIIEVLERDPALRSINAGVRQKHLGA